MAVYINNKTTDVVDRQTYTKIFSWLSQNLSSEQKQKACFWLLAAINEYASINEQLFVTKEQYYQFCEENGYNNYINRSWGTIKKDNSSANLYWLSPACYKLGLDYDLYLSAPDSTNQEEKVIYVITRAPKYEYRNIAELTDAECGSAKDSIWLSTFIKTCEAAKDAKSRTAKMHTLADDQKPPPKTSAGSSRKEEEQKTEETLNQGKSLLHTEKWEVTRVVCSFDRPDHITDGQFDQLRSKYKKIFKRRVEYFKGEVAKDSDTDIKAHFGGPGSVSQHARFAAKCALDILEYFKQWNHRNKSDKPVPKFTILIDTYKSYVSIDQEGQIDTEYPSNAKTINYLQSLNSYNQILASENTYSHIHRFIKCKQLHSDKDGKKVYQVISDRDIPTVFSPEYVEENPLVGRKKELNKIKKSWERAKEGDPQLVWVHGPPGIGKSHLVYSFVLGLKEDFPRILICQCLSGHSNTPYYPLIQMFKHALKIKTNSEKEKELHIKKFVEQLGLDEEKCVPLLLDLLETEKIDHLKRLEDDVCETSYLLVQKAAKVEKNREIILEILKSISKEPMILLLKDLDCIDPSTKKLFNQLLEDIVKIETSQKILIIASYNGSKPLNAKGISYIQKDIELEPLNHQYSEQIANNIIKKNALSVNEQELKTLLKKAGGIPHSIYASILNQNGPDCWFVKVMSELDNISDTQQIINPKRVAQIASLLGKIFEFDQLLDLIFCFSKQNSHKELHNIIDNCLKKVIERGLIKARPLANEKDYEFVCENIREQVYNSISESDRKIWHSKIAEFLSEDKSYKYDTTSSEVIAYHYLKASEYELSNKTKGEFLQKSVHWQQVSARTAMFKLSLTEAIINFEKIKQTLTKIHEESKPLDIALHTALDLGICYELMHGPASPKVSEIFSEAKEMAKKLNQLDSIFRIKWCAWFYTYLKGDLLEAEKQALELLSNDACQENEICCLEADHALWDCLFHRGKFQTTLPYHYHGSIIAEKFDKSELAHGYAGHSAKVCCHSRSGLLLWFSGFPDKALELSINAINCALEMDHTNNLAHAQFHKALLHYFRKEPTQIEFHAKQALDAVADKNIRTRTTICQIMLQIAKLQTKPTADSIDTFEKYCSDWKSLGVRIFETLWPIIAAEAYLELGEIEKGLQRIEHAKRVAEETGEKFCLAEMFRVQGQLLKKSGSNPQKTRQCFSEGIQIAQKSQAKMLHLRGLNCIFDLLYVPERRGHKELKAIIEELGELYGSFTEGFSSPDLKKAKEILSQTANLPPKNTKR